MTDWQSKGEQDRKDDHSSGGVIPIIESLQLRYYFSTSFTLRALWNPDIISASLPPVLEVGGVGGRDSDGE